MSSKPDDGSEPEVIYIPPLAFLRTVLALAWSAFRYPFSTTYIDATTGKVICRVKDRSCLRADSNHEGDERRGGPGP